MLIEDYDSADAVDILIDIANAKDVAEKEKLMVSLSGHTFAERPKRRVIFSDDYELEEEHEEYEGPDPVIFYDAQYGYQNSFEALGLDEDGEMKKRFYEERNREQKQVYHNEEESDMKEVTLDDLIDMLNAKKAAQEEECYGSYGDDGDDGTYDIPVVEKSEDGSMPNIAPEILLNGVPVREE